MKKIPCILLFILTFFNSSCQKTIDVKANVYILKETKLEDMISGICYIQAKNNYALMKNNNDYVFIVKKGFIYGEEMIKLDDIILAPDIAIFNGKSILNSHVYSVSIPKCSN